MHTGEHRGTEHSFNLVLYPKPAANRCLAITLRSKHTVKATRIPVSHFHVLKDSKVVVGFFESVFEDVRNGWVLRRSE